MHVFIIIGALLVVVVGLMAYSLCAAAKFEPPKMPKPIEYTTVPIKDGGRVSYMQVPIN